MKDYKYIQDRRTGTKHRILGVVDDTLTEEGIAADAKVVGDALATKAEVDGSYDSMTVGNAEQLISTVYEEDSVPYQFRTSGGSIDIGDREEDTIIGGTIVWNQQIQNGNFDSNTRWSVDANDSLTIANNVATFRASARYHNIVQGTQSNELKPQANHVYLGFITAKSYTNSDTFFYIRNVANGTVVQTARKTLIDTRKLVAQIIKMNQDGSQIQFMVQDNNASDFGDIIVEKAQMFNLTQMFGSTIADYIYSLEQTTAGAGVEWFRKLFPKPYYAYNAGELLSVSGLQSHDMIGFNAWDGETESGYVNNGIYYSSNDYWRTKNFIPVVGGASYYFKVTTGGQIACYDTEKTYITSIADFGGSSHIATMPSNCAYIKFYQGVATDKNTVCVNLSWDGERDGEYEPYKKWSYPLDDSLTLRGIPKLDADNKLYYDGDVYESDGTVTRKYGIVDLGSLTWLYDSNGFMNTGMLASSIKYPSTSSVLANIISTIPVNTAYGIYNGENGIGVHSNGNVRVRIYNMGTDASAFKTTMSGVYLVYELAEPTTESADPYQNPQIVDDFGTEEYVTTSIVPVGHETKYQPNLRAKLEMAPDSPDSNGTYVVKHENGENTYIPLTIPSPFPTYPYTPGNYRLQLQVTENSITLHWVEDN